MARTKASVGAKVAVGKSSKARCSVAAPPVTAGPSGSSDKSRSYSGGNSVCPRETPKWQKPITNFFISKDNGNKGSDSESDSEESTKSKPKRNIIQSDDEEEAPKNKELDETIELEPLTGENSHKISEYYTKNDCEENNNGVKGVKGKGIGKKTKGKENVSDNVERKRERDDKDAVEQASKRVRVE